MKDYNLREAQYLLKLSIEIKRYKELDKLQYKAIEWLKDEIQRCKLGAVYRACYSKVFLYS